MLFRLATLASWVALALLLLPGAVLGRANGPTGTSTTPHRAAAVLRVTYADVGQGDSIILRAGSWTGLIDGGPPGSDEQISAQLTKAGAKRIDCLVITHAHADHMGGLLGVISKFRPRLAVYADGGTTATWRAVKSALTDVGAKLQRVKTGATLAFGKLKAKVISPSSLSGEANDDSVVILLDAAGRRFFFTGDLFGSNEEAVGTICARGPPVYILKVAHHGSAYSTSSSFLLQARAKFAVISVGHNSYGHPSPETVARLKAHHVQTYTAQKNGTITVTVAKGGQVKWAFSGSKTPLTSTSPPGVRIPAFVGR